VRAYVGRRVGASLVVLFIASVVIFGGVHALPGSPELALAGEERDQRALQEIREKYGLDQPIVVQYARWLGLAVRGDLGESARTGLDVTSIIGSALPVTLELALLSVLVALLVGIPAGIAAARWRGKLPDYLSSGVALFGLSVPNFWLGLMLILVFSVYFNLLPASGFTPFFDNPIENLQKMVLPAITLGSGLAAVIMRQMRSAMLESLGSDYVRTARAKGLSERSVVGVHALRNSLITVVTIAGLQLGVVISGAVVTERIFVIPGFGKLIVDAVFQRDLPVIQAVVMFTTLGYVVVNFAVDILYSVLNPRIRITGEQAA
jgi:peptide/nickel transport system permease protein